MPAQCIVGIDNKLSQCAHDCKEPRILLAGQFVRDIFDDFDCDKMLDLISCCAARAQQAGHVPGAPPAPTE